MAGTSAGARKGWASRKRAGGVRGGYMNTPSTKAANRAVRQPKLAARMAGKKLAASKNERTNAFTKALNRSNSAKGRGGTLNRIGGGTRTRSEARLSQKIGAHKRSKGWGR